MSEDWGELHDQWKGDTVVGAEILRLRSELSRLKSERDEAIARADEQAITFAELGKSKPFDELRKDVARVKEAQQRGWDMAKEAAAKLAIGDVYEDHYRTWSWMLGDRHKNSELVKFSDELAAAILQLEMPK